MALSPYFNLDFNQTPNSEMSTFHDQGTPQVLVAPEHHHLLYHHHHHQDDSFFLPNTLFDSYFDPTSTFLYPEIYHNLLPYDPIISLSDIFPTTEDHHCNLLPCPKRQKCFHEEHDNSSINTFDGFVPNPLPAEEPVLPLPELLFSDPPMPEFQVPQLPHARSFGAYDDDHFQYDQYEKKIKGKITISAQSVAARERRRKITEKTQELGKLVPGGCRMNTAEMLHAAGKYVQYMQAQVQILQLMNTLQEDKAAPQDMQALLVSLCVQEMMYSEEKCFVPKDFITTLINHDNLQSRPSILKDLKQLIGTDIEEKAKQE